MKALEAFLKLIVAAGPGEQAIIKDRAKRFLDDIPAMKKHALQNAIRNN